MRNAALKEKTIPLYKRNKDYPVSNLDLIFLFRLSSEIFDPSLTPHGIHVVIMQLKASHEQNKNITWESHDKN